MSLKGFVFKTAAVLVIGSFLLVGCAGTGGSAGADQSFTLMTTARTAFFTSGPNELVPQGYLEPGTRIRVLSSAGGMTQVQTVDGRNGWVATGDIGALQEPQSRSQ